MVMTQETVPAILMKDFIRKQLTLRNRLPSQLAKDLGVSHPTVGRWLTGEDMPSSKCCWRLAELTGEPLLKVLQMAGHLPADFRDDPTLELPAFREYMMFKYPGKLASPILAMIERELILL